MPEHPSVLPIGTLRRYVGCSQLLTHPEWVNRIGRITGDAGPLFLTISTGDPGTPPMPVRGYWLSFLDDPDHPHAVADAELAPVDSSV